MRATEPNDRRVTRRRLARCALAVLLVAAPLVGAGACVLADPPAKVSEPPARRPRIVRESSTPPVTEILRTWPGTFHILVETQPGSALAGYAYLDPDPLNLPGQDVLVIQNLVAVDDAGQRVVDVTFLPPDPSRCHTVEILMGNAPFIFSRTPDPGTSDSISWFYSPTGDVTACAPFDGGIQPTDAATDAPADARRGD